MLRWSLLSLWSLLVVANHVATGFAFHPSLSSSSASVFGRTTTPPSHRSALSSSLSSASSTTVTTSDESSAATTTSQSDASPSAESVDELFQEFVDFLQERQASIIAQIEAKEASDGISGATFSRDCWGMFDTTAAAAAAAAAADGRSVPLLKSGGITRVLQGGNIVEKGACSLTIIQQGTLTADRAATIRARQAGGGGTSSNDGQDDNDDDDFRVSAGDVYSAAALSMVLHTRSPLVPTFRSDVRIFMVRSAAAASSSSSSNGGDAAAANDNDDTCPKSVAWFGGGADLTPYYLDDKDITSFHEHYKDLCDSYFATTNQHESYSYSAMKRACDDYFYLPARSEHRGTGGIFWDDMPVTRHTLDFTKGVADTWMPSWFPIVDKHSAEPYTDVQKQWQLLRRGRYLEFNLLYDRGVKFGLANANPRVEGVMVSAPPQIAYEYKHYIEPGSPEAAIMAVLKTPRDWVVVDE